MSFIETADGTRIRYHDRGRGPAIILIHGWKMSHRCWDRAALLLSKNFRVISYDLRGMGESDKPGSDHYFKQHAEDVACIMDKLDVQDAMLVGWSMGCSVILSCLQNWHEGIRQAVLMNGPVKLINGDSFNLGISPDYFEQIIDQLITFWPEREREWVQKTFRSDHPEHVDWFTRIALQTPLEIVVNVVKQQAKLDMREVIANTEVPILALYGRHDPYYPTELADWIAATAKNGRRIIFDESAHCPPVEETEKFVSVLSDFAGTNREDKTA